LLRDWRERALLTQEQLAERAGLSARTIRRLESGVATRRPYPSSLRMLAAALDLSEAEQAALAAAARWTPTEAAASDERAVPPGTAASSVPDGVPRQLPAPPPGFTGRVAELADLHGVRDAATVVITAIDGMAGIGKTALAVHAAHRLARHYPDGQLFLDLHGYTEGVAPVEPGDALERVLRALGVPGAQIPDGLEDRAALYRSRLADRKMLVVLDNAASEEQVAPLLPGAAGCLVVVTTRRRLVGLDHTRTLSLDVLPQPDAIELFARTAAVDDDASVAEVVELCGRLPLAIRIAAARLRSRPSWTATHLAARLRDLQERLGELEAGSRSVTATLDLSYLQLAPDVQRAYRLCGLHPGTDLDLYAAAALVDTAVREAERLISELLETHLVQEPVPGRYRFHDLVRAHATATATRDNSEPDRRAALTRLLGHYAHTASIATDVVYPHDRERHPHLPPADTPTPDLSGSTAATAWLDTQLPNLLATAHCATSHDWPDHIVHLSGALARYLRDRGRLTDAETLHSLALAAARGAGYRAGALSALTDRGEARRLQGRHEQAVSDLKQALEIARAIGDRSSEPEVLRHLSDLHSLQGRYELAAEHLAQALDITRETGNRSGEGEVLRSLGYVRLKQGRYEDGIKNLAQAREIARAIGNPTGELAALLGLAWFHRYQDRREQAIATFEQALDLARAIGNRNGELGAMIGLGWGHRVQGRYAQAADLYREMLELAQQVGSRNCQFEAFQGMGRLQLAAGRPHEALVSHGQALDLADELGQASDQAKAHDGLAHAHHALHHLDDARRHWQRALDILTGLGVDHSEDKETTATAIRAHLADLGEP
jgi:tetratricopeptide (TPR) repeat protein/transcriptional regulator with XRE-family HTH domain